MTGRTPERKAAGSAAPRAASGSDLDLLEQDKPDPAAVEAAITELWREFKASGDQRLRERLILHYSPLVKYVAGRVGVGLPPNIEQADLVSYGIFGLIDAIEKFDISRAIKFETYAISRIKGAIIDELRAIDWIPRSVRYKAREVEKAYAALEARLHRTPTEPEVAGELGITLDELHTIFSQVSFVNVIALDELLNVGGERGRQALPRRHPRGHQGRGPRRGVRDRGDEVPARPGDQHLAGAREDRRDALLLRGPHARRDRSGPGRDREPDLPDAHQGGPAAARQALRPARLTAPGRERRRRARSRDAAAMDIPPTVGTHAVGGPRSP